MQPAEIFNNKGTQLMHKGQAKAALAYFRRAVSLDNNNIPMRTNLAVAMSKLPEYEQEAKELLNEVLQHEPYNHIAMHALGVLAEACGDYEISLGLFKGCKAITGEHSIAHGYDYDIATTLIRLGRWREGWSLYDCRRVWKPIHKFNIPTWNGELGRKIYCWAEQGFGDMLMFSRYVPWLASQSEKVLLGVPANMFELFFPFTKVCDIAPLEQGIPAVADFEIPLMSLPRLYGERIPQDPNLIASASVKHFFELKGEQKIGVAWAAGAGGVKEKERRIPLDDLVQLAGDSRRKLYSLQADGRALNLYELGIQNLIEDMTPHIEGDWSATRDLLRELDVIVTTDTAVAHLAAIMQKPTIMLLGYSDSWRWSYDWYPTMTIFRQTKRNSWIEPLRQADTMLDDLLASSKLRQAS